MRIPASPHRIRSIIQYLLAASAAFLLSACGGGGGGGGPAPTPAPTTFAISGSVAVAQGVTVDSDVNDPNATAVANNTFGEAQALPNPATVAGYATLAPTNKTGDRFQSTADAADIYSATLAAGQVVMLSIGEHLASNPAAIDLDLGLFDSTGTTLIAQSTGTGPTEAISVPAAGDYKIVVEAAAGASNYTLTIGVAPASAGAVSGLALTDEFVPGEVIVRFKDAVLPAAGADTLAARAASVGLQAAAGGARRPMLMRLGNEAQRAQAMQVLGVAHKRGLRSPSGIEPSAAERERHDTARAVQALRARADVATADLNYVRRPALAPNDTHYGYQWHYPMINLPQAWEITTGTPAAGDVIVAVIDTGVMLSHPDFAGKLVAGYDFISDATRARDSGGIDADPNDPGDLQTPGKSSFHGTHVAGTIGAATNNGSGVAGVSWGAKIMPLRVLGVGGGANYDIIQAVRFAAGLPNDSGTTPAQRADIINLSLGGYGFSTTEQNEFTAARNAGPNGVIIIAAAGNDNNSQLFYPASYAGVVSVSALDMNKARAPYSNYGTEVDVAAPGGDMSKDLNNDGFADGVLSSVGDDSAGAIQSSYEFNNGTSMASPHVAGVAALMKAVHPTLTPAQFDTAISTGAIADELGAAGRDDVYGHGLINALKAVEHAKSLASAPAGAGLLASQSVLNFGVTRTALTVTVQKGGSGALTGVAAAPSAAWLTAGPATVDLDGLGSYTVNVNDASLLPGLYSGKITFSSTTAGVAPMQVAVTMEVGGAASGAGNAGVMYLVLADAATLVEVPGQTVMVAAPTNGSYAFSFAGVAPGRYYVFAGTDLNNDGFICDAGEACGAYPTLDRMGEVTVGSANVTGVNFTAGFMTELAPAAAGVARDSGKRIRR